MNHSSPTQPAQRRPQLSDVPEPVLRQLLEVLERQFPPAPFRSPRELDGPNIEAQMAMVMGQQSVIEAIKIAIRTPQKDKENA